MDNYEYWLTLDEETAAELKAITDKSELEDRFYKELEFGTGGMRGIMGAGPNRMNRYTVARATKGLAEMLKTGSVAVAYDSRLKSAEFARTAACVLCSAGIKVYLFDTLMPTPVLSFAVKHHSCDAGIVVTASHNPKEYNGYKVYDSNGCQLLPDEAHELTRRIAAVTDLGKIPMMPLDEAQKNGLLEYIGEKTLAAFLDEVKKLSIYKGGNVKTVYTPLHGTGNIPVRRILGEKNVSVVAAQELPDGNFSTVRSPNPEEKDALTLAAEQGIAENADIIIGTDPDCDRVGVGVREGDGFTLLTGNQTGALLTDFILRFKKDIPENAAIVKTIVTSGLGSAIAADYSVSTAQTLTGFKYIGKKICDWENSGEHTYIFGYEESYGCLAGTHAADKDAVSASMLITEMTAYWKDRGMTLTQALNEIYRKYGYYLDSLETVVLKGKEGAEKILNAMTALRKKGEELFEEPVKLSDYLNGADGLPKENVLKFEFDDGSWAAVRPSGTEPKLKMYFSVRGEDKASAAEKQKRIRDILFSVI